MRRSANGREARALSELTVRPQRSHEALRPFVRRSSQVLWRARHIAVENIPRDGSLIVVANHQTYFDPFWVSIPIRRPLRFLAWDQAFNWPVVGRLIGLLGAWPLQIEGGDPAAIRRSIEWLRAGGAVMIFPEGGRGLPDGSMVRFKPGAVRMALETNAPILPVTIRGAHRVWPKGQLLPRLAQIEIIYHPLHRVAARPGEDARQCARRETDQLADIIRSAL